MKIINIQEAKTHLSKFVEDVANGEEIIVAKAGKPMAKLVPFKTPGEFKFGILAGQIHEAPDCWDRDIELEELFYGPEDEVTSADRVAEPQAR
ncbi:MAG: type II toxin-antitoxin system prevent-host-death family antitoxin [Chthoniobacterales bacterium]